MPVPGTAPTSGALGTVGKNVVAVFDAAHVVIGVIVTRLAETVRGLAARVVTSGTVQVELDLSPTASGTNPGAGVHLHSTLGVITAPKPRPLTTLQPLPSNRSCGQNGKRHQTRDGSLTPLIGRTRSWGARSATG